MDFWDILDKYGEKTGKTTPDNSKLQQGEYHRIVHVWIADQNGEFLIQKKANQDLWCITSGAVMHDENSLSAAIRSTANELGLLLRADKLRKIKQTRNTTEFIDVWSASGTREDFFPVILCSEIVDVCWASRNALVEMINRNEFVRYDYMDTVAGYLSGIPAKTGGKAF